MADFSRREDELRLGGRVSPGILARLWSFHAGAMLWRNTVVSCAAFVVGLGVLWALVEFARMDEVAAAAIGFVAANSLHYLLGRAWIFRGTERGRASGYALFLINAGVGLALTVGLMPPSSSSRRSTTSWRGRSFRSSPGWWCLCSTRSSTSGRFSREVPGLEP